MNKDIKNLGEQHPFTALYVDFTRVSSPSSMAESEEETVPKMSKGFAESYAQVDHADIPDSA